MSTALAQPIAAFVQAKNDHDTDAQLACFADDALVHDEGQDIRGAAAIRAWSDAVIEKYRVRLDVLNVAEHDDETVLTVRVSVTFDGSPVDLSFHFTVRDGKIAALLIQ
jgi:hypothetical protein